VSGEIGCNEFAGNRGFRGTSYLLFHKAGWMGNAFVRHRFTVHALFR
jgi:hypothetical protein